MKILINEIDKKDLKAILLERGYSFPCNGKGICGKCRIIAEDLPITNLDQRFLSLNELEKGYRLACDKKVEKPLIIDCLLDKKPLSKPLGECDITIIFNEKSLVITVYADKIIDVVSIPIDGDLSDKNTVLSFISKETIELLEFYKVARATTILISGVREVVELFDEISFDGSLYNLPCEEVYILKGKDNFGSNIALELLTKENGLYILERDCKLYISLIQDNQIPTVILQNTDISKSSVIIKDLMERTKVTEVNFISDMPREDVLNNFTNGSFIKPLSVNNSVNCLISNRNKTLYNKLLRKIIIIDNNYEFV